MPENKIPYLCGGVLFFLMAHMKPSAGTARDHQSGLKDDHSDPVVMQDLIFAVKGSEYTTAAKDTSNYRECKNNFHFSHKEFGWYRGYKFVPMG